VVVIDHNTRQRLFGEGVDPLGQVILIGNLPCTVIGVAAENKNLFASGKTFNVWVPYETAAGRMLGQRYLDSISVRSRTASRAKWWKSTLPNCCCSATAPRISSPTTSTA
jgi:macrolide transport system ATP-binding/permease protein